MTPRPNKPSVSALEALERAQWIAFAPFVFQASCVLRDRGVLSAIESSPEGLTLEQIAEQVSLPHYGVRVLLEAGLGIGLVTEDDERRYHLTNTAHYLQHDGMTRANMDFTRDVNYAGIAHLDQAIATGKPAGLQVFGEWPTIYAGLAKLPEQVQGSWFGFDHFYSDSAFPVALPLVLKSKPRRLLDIGGNTGKWAIACMQHDPEIEVTIMDLPGQLDVAKANIAAAGLSDRVRFLAVDLLDEQAKIPGGFDVIWMSQFLDCFSEAEIVTILRRCAAALEGDARIFILETFWDRQRFAAAKFCLQMTSLYFTALANGNSQLYRADVFLECVRQAELEVDAEHDGIGLAHTLLSCRRQGAS
ncbi:methyltransferase [Enhygromyxa salina]|nr:methyltransferase [Enhygromyxa salina]